MGNSYFQFRQFRVEQEHCAMKVSTEACIFGAWLTPFFSPKSVLDIGTGTGLLSLMLAQRITTPIDAVEIDTASVQQAARNFRDSPWSDRMTAIESDIFPFAEANKGKYDLIISNPPFYTASHKSTDEGKNRSKHDTETFTKTKFVQAIQHLLTKEGEAFILYPKPEADEFAMLAGGRGMNVEEVLTIRNQPGGPVFRVVLKVGSKASGVHQELSIREGKEYSAALIDLLKPYYLYL